jgi:tRNA dimethylallyltransferase
LRPPHPGLVIPGATGTGKTRVATALAALADLEIVSADSRQVVRGLDIGTAKPTASERAAAPYHGLDLVAPAERYSAGRFAGDAARWIREIWSRGRMPVVVGGTGFYLRALFEGLFEEPPLDPERRRRLGAALAALPRAALSRWAARLDRAFRGGGAQRAARAVEVALLSGRPLSELQSRPAKGSGLAPLYAVLTLPRDVLAARIVERTRAMLEAGLVAEVRRLRAAGVPADAPGLSAVGYREVVAHLSGELTEGKLAGAIAAATRRYAKRQETWFRHQLRGSVATLDAAAAPEVVAREVLARYRAAAP